MTIVACFLSRWMDYVLKYDDLIARLALIYGKKYPNLAKAVWLCFKRERVVYRNYSENIENDEREYFRAPHIGNFV